MSSSSPLRPSTPVDTPRRNPVTRSFTLPPKTPKTATPPTTSSTEIGATKDVETLFTHPNASITKFTTPSRPNNPSKSPALLPWTSPTERRLAAGPMEIYRVPGSVSFLHSGSLLHAILPRSNCWCVDGVSKFALRVLLDTYYRIELPAEDTEGVAMLKETLAKVLFYERTPCPFERAFEVEGVEEEISEVIGRRKGKRRSEGPAKKWKLQGGTGWRPEGWVPPVEGEESSEGENESSEGKSEDEVGEDQKDTVSGSLNVESPVQPRKLGLRSFTSPNPTKHPARARIETSVNVDGTVSAIERAEADKAARENAEKQLAESQSLTPRSRTLQPIPTYMPPSPPDSSAGQDYVESQGHAAVGARDERGLDVTDSRQRLLFDGASDGRVFEGVSMRRKDMEGADEGREHQDVQESGEEENDERQDEPEDDENKAIEDDEEKVVTPVGHDTSPSEEALDLSSERAVGGGIEKRPHELDLVQADGHHFEQQDELPVNDREITETDDADELSVVDSKLTESGVAVDDLHMENLRDTDTEAANEPHLEQHHEQSDEPGAEHQDEEPNRAINGSNEQTTLPPITHASPETPSNHTPSESRSQTPSHSNPETPPLTRVPTDPYAAIHSRILARRSLNGSPVTTPPSFSKTTTTTSLATRPRPSFTPSTTTLVHKACAVFLGPPARLVAIMLRIAARYAEAAFGVDGVFFVEGGARGRVPGSFLLDRDEGMGWQDEEGEDDFGVPLRSPVRRRVVVRGVEREE